MFDSKGFWLAQAKKRRAKLDRKHEVEAAKATISALLAMAVITLVIYLVVVAILFWG